MLRRTHQNRLNRKRRIRGRIAGTAERPRLTVHRSHTQMTVQFVDDANGKTLLAASTREIRQKPTMDGAKALGTHVAKKAQDAKCTQVVFDRNAYKYHGRIKALADAAREGGLQF